MIGAKIHRYRMKKGLTLQELAGRTMTTAGYLSQLERDLTEPSLAALRKIASALDVPIFTLLNEEEEETSVTAFQPASSRHQVSFPGSGVVYELLTPPAQSALEGPDFLMMTFSLPAHSFGSEERVSHDAEECLYLTSGVLEVFTGEQTCTLEVGDCIRIPGGAPHNLYNPGAAPAEGICCLNPGMFVSTVRP